MSEVIFELERLNPEKIGGAIAQAAVKVLTDPEELAALSGTMLLPIIVARGRPMPFVIFTIFALMGNAGGRLAWRSYKNLETIAQAAKDA